MSKINLVVGKQEVDKFVYDKTQIGDTIKIRYLKSNSAINGVVNNKAPIIKRAIHMIIPAFVFWACIIGFNKFVNKNQKDNIFNKIRCKKKR